MIRPAESFDVDDEEVVAVVEGSKASDEDDELLEDLDNEVDTLTLTIGLSVFFSSCSGSSFGGCSSFLLPFPLISLVENGPKGILTNGVVVVESATLLRVEVLLKVGLKSENDELPKVED